MDNYSVLKKDASSKDDSPPSGLGATPQDIKKSMTSDQVGEGVKARQTSSEPISGPPTAVQGIHKNIKKLIGITAGMIIMTMISTAFFWYIEIHKCPQSCDDKNACTQDFCSEQTNYKCQYNYLSDCCGNLRCESRETYETCSADCPDCDDNNKCTKDSFNYHAHRCVNSPITDITCCGNSVCETGETYQNCAKDCPNCDDDNQCTKDRYDYYLRKCINEIIIPCCGNKLCDEGVENSLNCSKDCPNCNDGNRLTTDNFNYKTQKCENIVTHYFIDDFESGTQKWMSSAVPEDPSAYWATKIEGGNTVFQGIGHNWTSLSGLKWDNYIFKTKFKIIKGTIHFNYRLEAENRYFVGTGSGHASLFKQIKDKFYDLTQPTPLSLDGGWHTFEMRGYGNILNVLIDNNLLIKYKDTDSPLTSGGVGLETHKDSEFWIDEVEIKVIAEKDINYP